MDQGYGTSTAPGVVFGRKDKDESNNRLDGSDANLRAQLELRNADRHFKLDWASVVGLFSSINASDQEQLGIYVSNTLYIAMDMLISC